MSDNTFDPNAPVPGPPGCALAPWELPLPEARRRVAEQLKQIRNLQDQIQTLQGQFDVMLQQRGRLTDLIRVLAWEAGAQDYRAGEAILKRLDSIISPQT